ncbi:MAG: DUF4252 domain-containing protein [Cyclobacteriaceae bacterium]
MRLAILFSILVSLNISLVAQESFLKDFAKTRSDKKYTLYASTLRMLNVTKDENFNELVNDIEKINVFVFDSATTRDQSFQALAEKYNAESYDEYLKMYGGQYAYVAGKELGRNMEIIGLLGQKDAAYAIYIIGVIPLQKIPKVVALLRENQILNLLEPDK